MFDYFYGASGNHFSFFQIPEELVLGEEFRDISSDAKLLYSIMLKRVGLSYKNGWIDEKGRTYIIYTLEEAMKIFRCANQKATKVFTELETAGLIERLRQGQGKPCLVYVKDFANRVETVDTHDQTHDSSYALNHENHDSGLMKNMNAESWKTGESKRDISETRDSKRDPILSGSDGMDDYRRYKGYFKEKLETDILCEQYPTEKETIYSILELLTEVCLSKKKTILIAGDEKPAELVKGRFMELEYTHIQYVLGCLKDTSSDVRNIKQYLLAILFNAPATIGPYYQRKVSHDFKHSDPLIRGSTDY